MPPKFYQGDGNRFIVRWEGVYDGVRARIAAAKLEATAIDLDGCLDALADAVREKYGDHDPDWDITPRRPLPSFLVDKPRYITLDSRGVAHFAEPVSELLTPEYGCRECYAKLDQFRTDKKVTVERIEAHAAIIIESGATLASKKFIDSCPPDTFANFEFREVAGKSNAYVEMVPHSLRKTYTAKKWFSGFSEPCPRCGNVREETKNQPWLIGDWLCDVSDLHIFEATGSEGDWRLLCRTDFYEVNRKLLYGLSDYFESETIALPKVDLIEPSGFQLHPEDIRDAIEYEPWKFDGNADL